MICIIGDIQDVHRRLTSCRLISGSKISSNRHHGANWQRIESITRFRAFNTESIRSIVGCMDGHNVVFSERNRFSLSLQNDFLASLEPFHRRHIVYSLERKPKERYTMDCNPAHEIACVRMRIVVFSRARITEAVRRSIPNKRFPRSLVCRNRLEIMVRNVVCCVEHCGCSSDPERRRNQLLLFSNQIRMVQRIDNLIRHEDTFTISAEEALRILDDIARIREVVIVEHQKSRLLAHISSPHRLDVICGHERLQTSISALLGVHSCDCGLTSIEHLLAGFDSTTVVIVGTSRNHLSSSVNHAISLAEISHLFLLIGVISSWNLFILDEANCSRSEHCRREIVRWSERN